MYQIDLSQDYDFTADKELSKAYFAVLDRSCKISQSIEDECLLVHDPVQLASLLFEQMGLHGYSLTERNLFITRFLCLNK